METIAAAAAAAAAAVIMALAEGTGTQEELPHRMEGRARGASIGREQGATKAALVPCRNCWTWTASGASSCRTSKCSSRARSPTRPRGDAPPRRKARRVTAAEAMGGATTAVETTAVETSAAAAAAAAAPLVTATATAGMGACSTTGSTMGKEGTAIWAAEAEAAATRGMTTRGMTTRGMTRGAAATAVPVVPSSSPRAVGAAVGAAAVSEGGNCRCRGIRRGTSSIIRRSGDRLWINFPELQCCWWS